eukprot:5668918-Ditylum_brightwellii.AAC.1
MKVIWNRRLVPVAEKIQFLSSIQFGNRKGRTALDALLLKVVTIDCTWLFCLNGAILNNDAFACYNRMIPEVSSLHLQSLGLPDNTTKCSVLINRNMKRSVKMTAGVTKQTNQHTKKYPLEGEGQGKTPSLVAESYVDDTDCTYVNQKDQKNETLTHIQDRLKKIATAWECLIYGSGGKLSRKKTY